MSSLDEKDLVKKYQYLPETIERFVSFFGIEETKKMVQAYETPPKTTIRCNTLKITSGELKQRLEEKGFTLEKIDFYKSGFVVDNNPLPLGATTEYLAGYYFIQSKASWLPVLLLEPSEDEVIIDMAAAPGGKATHIAAEMNNKGTVICLDISRERMKSLRSNLTRLGVINTICFRMDSRDISDLGIKADKILLDAPCSGEGLMAIDPTRKKERNIEDIRRLAQLQKELISAGLKELKKNGFLVYATCSTAPEENEEIINWAIDSFPIKVIKTKYEEFSPGLTKANEKQFHPSIKNAIRLFPHKHGTEGFFTCKLKLLESINE